MTWVCDNWQFKLNEGVRWMEYIRSLPKETQSNTDVTENTLLPDSYRQSSVRSWPKIKSLSLIKLDVSCTFKQYLILSRCTLNKEVCLSVFTETLRLTRWIKKTVVFKGKTQFPKMVKVHQHVFCACPVPVEVTVSAEDNQWRHICLCLSLSRKTFLLTCSSTLSGEMEEESVYVAGRAIAKSPSRVSFQES